MKNTNKYTKTCLECNKQFETKKADKEFCCSNHKLSYFKKQETKNKPKRIIECAWCEKKFQASKKNAKFCNIKCQQNFFNRKTQDERRKENYEKYKDDPLIPTCKICGWKAKHLTAHLRNHKLTVQQYMEKFNVDKYAVFHPDYLDFQREKIKGENNPGYQHGGTMSSFSKKFKKYENLDENEKEKKIQSQVEKVKKTKTENGSYNTWISFYKNQGMTEQDAMIARSERQRTFSKDICIEKYGEEEGIKIWRARQEKWQQSIDNNGNRQRVVDGSVKGLNKASRISKSAISCDLFQHLNEYSTQWGDNEQVIRFRDGTYCFPDFLYQNKIIEFYGSFWHGDPLKFNETDVLIFPGNIPKVVKDLREKDKIREQKLIDHGYEVLVVWESEYKSNKMKVLKKCLQFLMNYETN